MIIALRSTGSSPEEGGAWLLSDGGPPRGRRRVAAGGLRALSSARGDGSRTAHDRMSISHVWRRRSARPCCADLTLLSFSGLLERPELRGTARHRRPRVQPWSSRRPRTRRARLRGELGDDGAALRRCPRLNAAAPLQRYGTEVATGCCHEITPTSSRSGSTRLPGSSSAGCTAARREPPRSGCASGSARPRSSPVGGRATGLMPRSLPGPGRPRLLVPGRTRSPRTHCDLAGGAELRKRSRPRHRRTKCRTRCLAQRPPSNLAGGAALLEHHCAVAFSGMAEEKTSARDRFGATSQTGCFGTARQIGVQLRRAAAADPGRFS